MGHHNWIVAPVAATTTTPPTFTARATPLYRESGLLSYYVDETGIIRAADRTGSPAQSSDPTIDPKSAGERLSNERIAYYLMGAFRGAQNNFSNFGAQNYGTYGELQNANQFWLPFQIDRLAGYVYSLSLTPRNGSTPPHWELRLVPEEYGITGNRSFYTDETGYVHGADNNGAPAGPKDPVIYFLD
jgi:hypothetical protein